MRVFYWCEAMEQDEIYGRYQELQQYVGWTEDDAARVHRLTPVVEPHFTALIDDFYAEIERHPRARKVITGGAEQIARLKGTLTNWLKELFTGKYDADYVARRWRVGLRHVEIGLNQVYTNAALSRLRGGLLDIIGLEKGRDPVELLHTRRSLNMLLDLDLALIEDAYQTEYQRRQQAAERLATIGQVAGGVAHELRNPLNVIKTSVYYLRNARNTSPEKQQAHLERIDRQVSVADGVIMALNSFARLPLPELTPIELRPLLQESLESNPLPGNIRINVELPAELPPVLGDRGQLVIVFGNLIRNARDAMPEGGQLSISAEVNAEEVGITVGDDGGGISPENLGRIMEPLYTTKSRGIGLGLAITRAIIEKHSGRLNVSSEPGNGARFTVHLTKGRRDPSDVTEGAIIRR
jgi:signal transduction histidine kinase